MSKSGEKILYGSTVPQYEMDDEVVDIVVDEAEDQYNFVECIDAYDTEDFKAIFYTFLTEIRRIEVEKQAKFCYQLLEKVKEKYRYEPNPSPSFSDRDDVEEIYDFVSFLEFEYIDFFALVWKEIKIDFRKTNMTEFCLNNDDRIISIAEEQIDVLNSSEMVKSFLRTYYKDGFIQWFSEKTEESKMLILLKTLQGEEKENGEHKNQN